MSEFQNRRRQNFTIIANQALLDPTLSLRAKGLLCLMLSRPDNWTYRMDWICKQSKEGREATQAAIKELIGRDYVVRQAKRDLNTGKLEGWVYIVSDTPPMEEPSSGLTVERESRLTVSQADSSNKENINTDSKKTDINHTPAQISEPVLVSDSASAPSDVCEIPDSNFWEEMPDLSELESLASLEHQAETVFVPSQESSIKKIELEQKAQPDLKKVSGGAAELVDKIVDKSPTRFNPRDVDLHESIPREAWLEWCQHRTEKRSPLTPIATKKQLAQLLEFAITGQTPQESIDHAISHSWQGFYLIRKARAGYVGKPQTTQEANERMVDSAASLYAACLKQDQERAAQRGLNA